MSDPIPRLSRAPRRVPLTLSTRVVLAGFLGPTLTLLRHGWYFLYIY